MCVCYAAAYSQDTGDGTFTKLHITKEEKLEIVPKSRALERPDGGYFVISPGQDILQQFKDMSFSEDLVPRLVKLKLKAALQEALELQQYFRGNMLQLT